MQNRRYSLLGLGVATAFLFSACGGDPADPLEFQPDDLEEQISELQIPEFYVYDEEGNPGQAPGMTEIANIDDGLRSPNDLEFHPHEDRKDELWIINEGRNSGGDTVTLFNAGQNDQEALKLKDGNAGHFMARPPAMAFGDNGFWATSCGVEDANYAGGNFAGPSLWSSDFEIYAAVGNPPTPEVNGSHLDMLHGSPLSMGIAHEVGNAYWVYDGFHGHIVRYDFQEPHYPGGYDHSDGLIHRYKEIEIEMKDETPSHMIVDKEERYLYVNDTGNQRVLKINIDAGEMLRNLGNRNEPLEEHWEMHNAEYEVLINAGLDIPVGIAIQENRLFISDAGTGEIIAFDKNSGEELGRIQARAGIRGMTIGPDQKIWFVDYTQNSVFRVDPR